MAEGDLPGREELLRRIPSVDEVIQSELLARLGPSVSRQEILSSVRMGLARLREEILRAEPEELSMLPQDRTRLAQRAGLEAIRLLGPSLRRVINATGVIIHTNLGRSILAKEAIEAVEEVASRYSNLEFDLDAGRRGSRQVHAEGILRRLTGAEGALVVNNNAAAVLISLNTLAKGREVVVSRGELVEIGGSFRMPEVMAHSGACLREVGTTNKTHVRDYEAAIGPETGLLLKVHQSNYRIVGFTQEVHLDALVQLGTSRGIPVMVDLGSGCLLDLTAWGIGREPTVQETLKSGVDLVTFSGDKLLGGPQAGIILGKGELVRRIRGNPLHRALRVDKMTLAALEATLRLYWDPSEAVRRVPTLRMMVMSQGDVRRRAGLLAARLRRLVPPEVCVSVRREHSQVGGGSLPLVELPTWVVGLKVEGVPALKLEQALREGVPPVIARILKEEVILDLRTVQEEEVPTLAGIVAMACRGLSSVSRGEGEAT